MKTPETSRLFTRWRHPVSGIDSFVLTTRAAPVQKNFYYTNPSLSADRRFLWLVCARPPSRGASVAPVLAVVDFETDELRVYPETGHNNHAAAVDPATGEAYWVHGLDIWKRGPLAADRLILVNRFPAQLAEGAPRERIATHLSFSADRRAVNVDAHFGSRCFIGEFPLDGSPFRLWHRFEGWFYDHGLFSPTDPDLQLFAHEFWRDHATEPFDGARPYHRVWLLRRGGVPEPLLPQPLSHAGHEWWDASGKHVWLVHYGVGALRIDLASRGARNLWPGHLPHAHADRAGRYLVADQMADPHNPSCHVMFRDTLTGGEIAITDAPRLSASAPRVDHLHPHPQFCGADHYICHTTFVFGRADVALVPVAALIDRTQDHSCSIHRTTNHVR